MKLQELIRGFTTSREWDALSKETCRAYYRYLKMLPDIDVNDLTQAKVAALHSSLGCGGANLFRSSLGRLMSWAAGQGHKVPSFSLPHVEMSTREEWDREELEHYFDLAPSNRIALAMAIGFFTAQRTSDVLNIKWSDIIDGAIHITQRKTGAQLRIPIHERLADILEKTPRLGEYVVNGTKISPASFPTLYRAFVPKDKPSFHGVRKAACIALAEGGCTPHEIMSISGHTTIAMVQHYTKKVDQAKLAKLAIQKMK